MPEYVNDGVYQTLVRICASAGIKVKYRMLDDDIYARTDLYTVIWMPDSDNFRDPEHAALVLGHELAHLFVNDFHVDKECGGFLQETLIEAECDRLGVYFYKLAEKITYYEAEAIWRDKEE